MDLLVNFCLIPNFTTNPGAYKIWFTLARKIPEVDQCTPGVG